jgi:hypothetical protein
VERVGQEQGYDDDFLYPVTSQTVEHSLRARLTVVEERNLDPQVGAQSGDATAQGLHRRGRAGVPAAVSQGQ